MTKTDGEKTINFIETYYKIKLTDNERLALSRELKEYTYETFTSELKNALLKSTEYFTIASLHRVIENDRRANEFLKRSGKTNWYEFYANN